GNPSVVMSMQSKPILLVLKTPPPIGGGELRFAALRDHVRDDKRFVVLELSSGDKNKGNQGVPGPGKVLWFLGDWVRFVRLLRRHRPALVFYPISKSFLALLRDSLFFWVARGMGIPMVGELAGEKFHFLENSRLARWYGKAVLSRFRCIRVLGRWCAEELRRYGLDNTIVSDNGVPAGPFAEHKAVPKDGTMEFLYIGTYSARKGFDNLVEACQKLIERGLVFRVHAMGEWISPRFRRDTEAVLEESGLDDKFIFHGIIEGPAKFDVFSECQVLVVPSTSEGQPLVILEAFSMGMPVVATSVGGIPDVVTEGVNGLLVPSRHAGALADAMAEIARDGETRRNMSRENRALYLKRFTQERYLDSQITWLLECAKE
ncbi:glycosyltransferase family 4 protein, partial [Verrucomicrobiota bacterium]